jgi:hypothetical protein
MQAPLIISKPLYSSKQTQRNTLFILFWSDKSLIDEGFAMVPMAWTTHVQGQPQLLRYLSPLFTLINIVFTQTPTLFIEKNR